MDKIRLFLTGILMVTFLGSGLAMGLKLRSKDVPEEAEKLESVLYQLTQAGDYKEFSENRGLFLSDGKVRVVIELKAESTIVEDYENVIIESHYKNLVKALVPIDDLIPLANEPYVRFIRTPHLPIPHIPTPQQKREKVLLEKTQLGDQE